MLRTKGIQCACCGQVKPAYNFPSSYSKSTVVRYFRVNPEFSANRCWECNGDYRCIGCGEVQAASQFRVGGRFCKSCRNAGIASVLPVAYRFYSTRVDEDSLATEIEDLFPEEV